MSDLARDGAKAPEEIVAVRWKFGAEMTATAEAITGGSIVITLTCLAGTATPAVTVVGAPAIDGTDVVALLTGGLAGALWRRHCQIDTSAGQRLVCAKLLPIEAA